MKWNLKSDPGQYISWLCSATKVYLIQVLGQVSRVYPLWISHYTVYIMSR